MISGFINFIRFLLNVYRFLSILSVFAEQLSVSSWFYLIFAE